MTRHVPQSHTMYTLTRDSHWWVHRHTLLPAHTCTHRHTLLPPHTCTHRHTLPHTHTCVVMHTTPTHAHTHAHGHSLPHILIPHLLVLVLPGACSCHQFFCLSPSWDCHCHPRWEGCWPSLHLSHPPPPHPPVPQHPAPSTVPTPWRDCGF